MLTIQKTFYKASPVVSQLIRTSAYGYQQVASQTKGEENAATIEDLKRQLSIQFTKAKLGFFTQSPPHQENPFTNNAFLTQYLQHAVPKEVRNEIWGDLLNFGRRAVTDIYNLGRECELNPPVVRTFDAWGNRQDELVTCSAWKQLKRISAEEGLIATAYEGKFAEYDRLYQMVKLYLFSPVSGLYSCPLAMTDGAAKTASVLSNSGLEKAYKHLTSRDPDVFWTSGQWMTEKKGGSDVSGGTETLAIPNGDESHSLFGYKWFSSATDADMALTLASIVTPEQPCPKPRSLTMFYLEVRDAQEKLNGIEIVKLKNKLGTKQLPTAELLLDGTRALQISPEGRGIASIANMLTITRLHNAIAAVASMRRMLQLARDYSIRRSAFDQQVSHHPLHQLTTSRMEVNTRGCEILTLHVAKLLGREEAGVATEGESMVLRILTPILKLFTAKQSIATISEALECFGGQGYIEDTGLPVHLRDAQVLPIWEGTTNIMSLDMVRALIKTGGEAVTELHKDVKERIAGIQKNSVKNDMETSCIKVTKSLDQVLGFMQKHPELIQVAARDIAISFAHIYTGALLLEFASWEPNAVNMEVAGRWCEQPLVVISPRQYNFNNDNIVMDGYQPKNVHGPMF
ncbi:acyl-CoA dehydrogenase family member 11-like [Oratosquilla oratoria]|uniref:acyl-CoA dehydrogenase family member 11-like n=1 Tax=Oratosquilla oratoria TaxID=337810 RepID=UPI003F76E6D3